VIHGGATPTEKQALRRRLRAQRRALVAEQDRGADGAAIAAAASALLDNLAESPGTRAQPAYGDQLCVAIYRSLPHEPPTEALAEMLHARRALVIVPETLPDMDLDWHELRADGSEGPALGLGGIAAAQVILAPALAVDHSGTRLGQGGGCYDRALARRRADAAVVAIVNDQEYVGWPLPYDAHDVRMDAVITPGGGFTPVSYPESKA